MQELEDKYIELLLKRCLNFNKSKILFLNYQMENIEFIKKLEKKAYEMGIEEVFLRDEEIFKRHEVLQNINLLDIDNHPLFNNHIWDEYAARDASFLLLESEFPGLMDDIDLAKVSKVRYVDRATKPLYKKKQLEYSIPWCIAAMPSVSWAKYLFPDLADKEAYEKLFKLIISMSMANTIDPIASWNNFFASQEEMVKKLNELEIREMHYTNSLGTDLTIYLHENAIWRSAGRRDMIVNCPSYEIFTTPIFSKTNGIVYSSRPLCYNGVFIEDFYLVFKDGKVVDYGAKENEKLIEGIITSDEYAAYLGECALVPNDSPVSNTKLVYGSTLLDENASCHLALGAGFNDCLKNGSNLGSQELLAAGINPSKNHIDFMIGTPDLNIEAVTNQGKKLIFKNGEFNL